MKYQPPKLEELSPEQRALYAEILAEEKTELKAIKTDHETRQRSEAYHVATTALLNERANNDSAFTLEGPISDEEIEKAFREYDVDINPVPVRSAVRIGMVTSPSKRAVVQTTLRFRRLKTNKSRISDAVHAVVAKSGSKG